MRNYTGLKEIKQSPNNPLRNTQSPRRMIRTRVNTCAKAFAMGDRLTQNTVNLSRPTTSVSVVVGLIIYTYFLV